MCSCTCVATHHSQKQSWLQGLRFVVDFLRYLLDSLSTMRHLVVFSNSQYQIALTAGIAFTLGMSIGGIMQALTFLTLFRTHNYMYIFIHMYTCSTIITLLFVAKIFLDGICCQKICYSNINLVQKFFSVEGSWLMVILSLITATAYLALMLVGSLEHFNSRCPSIFLQLHMIAMHIA